MDTIPGSPNGGMHPQDLRNLIIFLVCSVLLWFAFDRMVLKPRMEAARAQQAMLAKTGPAPTAEAGKSAEEKTMPRGEALSATPRVKIETPQLSGSLSLTGARIDDIELKNYFTSLNSQEPVSLYSPQGTDGAYYAESGWIADDKTIKLPTKTTVWKNTSGSDTLTPKTPLTLEWNNGAGLTFERTLSVDADYVFEITQKVTNASGKSVTLYPYSSITRKGIPKHSTTVGYEGPLGYIDDHRQEIKYPSLVKKPDQSFEGQTGWIGMSDKYWLSAIIPEQKGAHSFRFTSVPATPDINSLFQVDAREGPETIQNGASASVTSHVFIGVKKVRTLEMYELKLGVKHLNEAIDFGIYYFLTRPMYFLLTLFNSWVGNFGIAIIMLTCVVRFAVFPLANASYRSFAKMKKVQPKMAEIRVRHATDKPKLQQELIKLYETEKVNPMAGCLPLVLQIPIFFAVYKVISISIEMRHAPFFGWIHDLSEKDPLSVFNLFGLLPFTVPEILHIGPWSVAMLVLMILQKQLNPPPTDAIQKDMMRFTPWIMTFVLSKFPSGLVIYWTFSNLISLVQQYAIMRQMGVPVYLFAKDEALAHEQSHKEAVKDVIEKAKLDKEYLKHRAIDVEEALFDAEDKLIDAVEGNAPVKGEEHFKNASFDEKK